MGQPFIAGAALPLLRPWHFQAPRYLYKYFPPERFHILTDCKLRFTQRRLFPDDREFRPDIRNFGTEEEIRGFIEHDELLRTLPGPDKEALLQHMAESPHGQERVLNIARANLSSPDKLVALCLSAESNSPRMWHEYAAEGSGFVLEFDSQHPGFSNLTHYGRLGRVTYDDEPLHTFLGSYGPDAFFRKRRAYSFENEWRCVRADIKCPTIVDSGAGAPIYLVDFGPGCIKRILVKPESPIEQKLRVFASVDFRYRHLRVEVVP